MHVVSMQEGSLSYVKLEWPPGWIYFFQIFSATLPISTHAIAHTTIIRRTQYRSCYESSLGADDISRKKFCNGRLFYVTEGDVSDLKTMFWNCFLA